MNLRLVYPLTKHCFPFVYQVGSIRFLGNWPPTPPLSHHFARSEEKVLMLA